MRRDRHGFFPNTGFLRFDAVAMALRMESVPTAEKQAISVSSSQFRPRRPPHLCPSRLSRAVCLQERLSTVPSDNRWPKVLLLERLDLEAHRCHHPLAARSPTPDSPDSHPRGMLVIHLEPRTIRLPQRTPTVGGGPMRKTTTRVCHLPTCTENTTPADAPLRLPARAAPHRSHSTIIRRTQASSPATGPAPHVVKVPILPSRPSREATAAR